MPTTVPVHSRLTSRRTQPHILLSLAIAALGVAAPTPTPAQTGDPGAATEQTGEQRQYDIEGGRLDAVLNQFALAAGVDLSVSTDLTRGKTSPGLLGQYSVEQALRTLLAGSGLSYRFAGENRVTLLARQQGGNPLQLAPINVSAAAERTGTATEAYRVESANVGILGDKSLQNTPYSIEIYSRELMDNLQARSISDATKLDASVSLSSGDLVAENNTLAIRGISPDFDTGQKLDGMNLRSRAKDLPLEHIERIDILKGAGGFLYGFGAPGGIINYVLKRPTDIPVRTINVQAMDSGLALVHGDLGGRLGDKDQFGYRINAVHESGDTYIRDGESRRGSASIALDWHITPELVWRVDALASSHTRYGGQWAVTPNADGEASNFEPAEPLKPIRGDKRLAPSWATYGSTHQVWGTDLNWAMTDDWNLELAHRHSENYRLFHLPGLFANKDGDYSAFLYSYNNFFESDQTQILLNGNVTTGPVHHNLVVGASHTETVSSNSGPKNQFVNLGSGNLSNPEEFPEPFARLDKRDAKINEYSRLKRREWFISDTVNIGRRWDLVAGLRHAKLKDELGDYDEQAITPTLALVHRPVDWLSVYASYVEALEQGATAPETAENTGETFEPLVSDQKEIGVKLNTDRWSVNAALFQLRKGLTYTTANNVFTQDGEARFEGLELSTKANIGHRSLVMASALWLDARNEKTTDSSLEGRKIQGVAREQFRLYGEHTLTEIPLTLNAGAQYVGKRPVDPQGQWSVDGVTLFDLGARYETSVSGRPITLRLNIDNVTNEAYWLTSSGSTSLAQGSPRTARLGVEIPL